MKTKRQIWMLTVLGCFFFINTFSQDESIEWQNTIGGSGDETMRKIIPTSDGGYLVGGYSNSGISGDKTDASFGGNDYWVLKLSATGDIEWQSTIGGSGEDYLRVVLQTEDGGYFLAGDSVSNISGNKTEDSNGGSDFWVVKLNAVGVIEWQNTLGGNDEEFLVTANLTTDGGYFLGGHSLSGISGDKTEPVVGNYDMWAVKLDETGVIDWQNTIGGTDLDFIFHSAHTADGGYIVGGPTLSGAGGDKTEGSNGLTDFWVVKLDENGIIEWQNSIGGNSYDSLYAIYQTPDLGYVLGGRSESGISGDKTEASNGLNDIWIVRLDASGEILWQNSIGGNAEDLILTMNLTEDNGFVIGGHSSSGISGDKTEENIGGLDFWVIVLDSVGEILWQNTIGGNADDFLRAIHQTDDGGFIFGGPSSSDISGDKTENSQGGDDFWVVKISGPPILGERDFETENAIRIFPNPVTSEFSVFTDSDQEIKHWILFDQRGKIVNKSKESLSAIEFKIDMQLLPSGIYMLKLENENGIFHKKIVKQ